MKTITILFLILFFGIRAKADEINHVELSGAWGTAATFQTSFNWDVTTESLVADTMTTQDTGIGALTLASISPTRASWEGELGYLQFYPHDHGIFAAFDTVGEWTTGALFELWKYNGAFYFPNGSATASTGSLIVIDPPDSGPVSTPEPATWAMLIGGLSALVILGGRRCRKNGFM
jgi:hypothetical protein